MAALKKTSTGHDWKKAPPDERREFCRAQAAAFAPKTPVDAKVLQEALGILYQTDRKRICDMTLGDATTLIARGSVKSKKS